MTQTIDRDGRSTIASAEGQAALAAGDTQLAQDKFAEAGAILEREMRRATDEEQEHLLRFLAATQFYKGGHYGKALELAEGIVSGKLPAGTRLPLPGFMRDVKGRASPDYAARIKSKHDELWAAKDYSGIIDLFKEHPYVLHRAKLAYLRAVCCEKLGKYRPAVLFFHDAARWAPNDLTVLTALAILPLTLPGRGKPNEAWEYVQTQLELFPNVVSYAVATLLCTHRVSEANSDARTAILGEQMGYFAQAREEYEKLPERQRKFPDIKSVMSLAYESAALGLYLRGGLAEARQVAQEFINFAPTSPKAQTTLAIIAFGSPEAVEASKKAIELGSESYFPYYCVAYDANSKGDFAAALDFAEAALQRAETRTDEVKSLIHQLAAKSRANLGSLRDEGKADPTSEVARHNYEAFLKGEEPTLPPPDSEAWHVIEDRNRWAEFSERPEQLPVLQFA